MASALELNATATIINGHGVSTSPELIAAIAAYQNLPTVTLVKEIYQMISNAGIPSELRTAITSLGANAQGTFLLDLYPTGITPTCSGNVQYYGSITTPVYDSGESPSIIGYSTVAIGPSASFSKTLTVQANLPTANGLAGFANVYSTISGDASSALDTVGSIKILKEKTYSESGLGYTGPADLATGGIGSKGALFANVVSNWGTMYDIQNITQFGNVYVFGQHLLNQQLGDYGLTDQFINAGLNLGDLTKVSSGYNGTYQEANTVSTSTFVGSVEFPTLSTVTVSIPVTASTPTVMTNIYKTVTGSNLSSIAQATNITVPVPESFTTLNDYLDLSKLATASDYAQLKSLGITTLEQLGTYFHKTLGQASFDSWKSMGNFFRSINVPVLKSNISALSSDKILSNTAISTLSPNVTTGTGELDQPLIADYLGAMAGIPYTAGLQTVITYAPDVGLGVQAALSSLKSAITAWLATATTTTDEQGGSSTTYGPITPVTNAVSAVNSALNNIESSDPYTSANVSYNNMITHLSGEVSRLTKAKATFNAGPSGILKNFGPTIISSATDKDRHQGYQFFANVISNDEYGDTIRLAISEAINQDILAGAGITNKNDPQPSLAISQASSQNIPLSTYLSQNK